MSDEIMDDQVNEEAVEDTTEDQLKGDEPHSEEHDVSEEELDEIADTAIAALKGILEHFDVGEVTIDEYEGDEGELILDRPAINYGYPYWRIVMAKRSTR